MRIYLDTCTIQRPVDDVQQARVQLEAEAVLDLIDLIEAGGIDLVGSYRIRKNSVILRKAPRWTMRIPLLPARRPKNLVDGRTGLSVTTFRAEKPALDKLHRCRTRFFGRRSCSSAREGSRGRLPQNDSDPCVRCFSGFGIRGTLDRTQSQS